MAYSVGGLSSVGRLSVEGLSCFLRDKGFESEITDSLKGMVGFFLFQLVMCF